MSTLVFLIILILIGIFLIYRYNKLPKPLITFFVVFAIMCIIYTLPSFLMLISKIL